MKKHTHFLWALALFVSISVQAQGTCDCQQIVGTCSASISVKPTGAAGSYGADLIFLSTSSSCSKINYYLENTPHFTILSNSPKGSDSAWGQKPFTRDMVTYISCEVCKRMDESSESKKTESPPVSLRPSFSLSGSWHVTATCSFGTGSSTWEIVHDQDTGSITGKLSNGVIDAGSIQGDNVTISGTAGVFRNNQVEMQGKVLSPTKMAGTYSQEVVDEICNWKAVKR